MQAKLQMSAGVEYDFDPSKTSGALYHRVATPSVNTGAWELFAVKDLTNPKSHSFMLQFELMRIFEGFRSRWIILPECRYFRAFANWYMMNFMWTSFRIPYAITLCRSASMNSKTKYTSLLLSALIISCSFMIFGWFNCFRISIYRYVLWASVACWNASNIFFSAKIFLVAHSSTFQTCPYAPEPTFLMILNFLTTWFSIWVECEDYIL